MIKNYIFDFDGTLVDSMPALGGSVAGYLDEKGIAYGEDLIKTTMPLGYKKIAAYYREVMGAKDSEEEIYAYFLRRLKAQYHEKIVCKPYAAELLSRLNAAGGVCCVLTASPHFLVDECAKRNGLPQFLRDFWTVEDFGNITKSSPEIFIEAAKRLNAVPEECALFDDNIDALRAAKRAGFRVFGVYDEFSSDYAEEIRGFADDYFTDFSKAGDILL